MFYLLFVLVVCGVIVYLVNNLIPLPSQFKMVINCLVGLILLWYVLSFFGLLGPIPVGRPLFR